MPRVTACTVVAQNYLPAARVLARSYLEHHAGHQFVILVIDAPWGSVVDEDGVRVVGPDIPGISELDYLRMAIAYSVTELRHVGEAVAAAHAAATTTTWPSTSTRTSRCSRRSPELVGSLAAEHGIVLTPHVLEPMPRDGQRPSEADIMASGVFNLGLRRRRVRCRGAVPASSGPTGCARTRSRSVTEQLFTDQRWVDNVPALFAAHGDPRSRLQRRLLERLPAAAGARADGRSPPTGTRCGSSTSAGYRPEKPWLLSTHYARQAAGAAVGVPVSPSCLPATAPSCVAGAGYRRGARRRSRTGWNKLPDGIELCPTRCAARTARRGSTPRSRTGTLSRRHPFRAARVRDLRRLGGPRAGSRRRAGRRVRPAAGLSRMALAVYEVRDRPAARVSRTRSRRPPRATGTGA